MAVTLRPGSFECAAVKQSGKLPVQVQGVHSILSFSKNCQKFSTPLRQNLAAIGCTNNYLPKGVTVHSHCVERVLKVSYSGVGEGGVVKKHDFS